MATRRSPCDRHRHPGRRLLGLLPPDATRPAPTCSATTTAPASSRRPPGRRGRDIAALRELRRRAPRRIDESALDEQRADHPGRARLRRDAPAPTSPSSASSELAADPIFGEQVVDADPDGDAGAARRRRRRGAGREVPRARPLLPRARRAAARGRRRRRGSRPPSPSRDTIAQLDGLLATPSPTTRCCATTTAPRRTRRRRLEGAPARRRRVGRPPRHGGLPRRAARRGARRLRGPTTGAA